MPLTHTPKKTQSKYSIQSSQSSLSSSPNFDKIKPSTPKNIKIQSRNMKEWENVSNALKPNSSSTAQPRSPNMPTTNQTAATTQKHRIVPSAQLLTFSEIPEASAQPDENFTKAIDRVREGRALLVKTKTYLSESRNMKTDLKTGIANAVDRLFQLLKDEAADSAFAIKKDSNREEKTVGNIEGLEKGNIELLKLMKEQGEKLSDIKDKLETLNRSSYAVPEKVISEETSPTLPRTTDMRRTYKEALMKPRFPVMIESSDPLHSSQDVVKDLKDKIDVVDLGIGVSSIRGTKGQKVVINCDSEDDRLKLTEAIKATAVKLSVSRMRTKKPLLRLLGVAHDLSDSKLEEAIVKQNLKLLPSPHPETPIVKVLRRTKGRNDSRSNVIVEVAPWIWKSLRDHEIRIGFQVVLVIDHSPVTQCFKCLGFGHMARDCNEEHCCGYCAGNHDTRECANRSLTPCCTNCKNVRSSSGNAHPAYSSECPEWQRWDKLARTAVSYC